MTYNARMEPRKGCQLLFDHQNVGHSRRSVYKIEISPK